MWIPYNFMAPLKAESPPQIVAASEALAQPRSFIVGFFLRGVAARTWETDVLVTSLLPQTQNVGQRHVALQFAGTDNGKLSEIIYTLQATSAIDAVDVAYAGVHTFVDTLCVSLGRGIDVIGWRVADTATSARWRSVPFLPSALLATASIKEAPLELRPLLRVYREARGSTSPLWRLTCAFTIISQLLRSDHSGALSSLPITTDMLMRSGAYGKFPKAGFSNVAELLAWIAPRHQSALSLFGLAGEPGDALPERTIDGDGDLTALANLADLVARDLLLARLQWDPTSQKVAGPAGPRLTAADYETIA